MFDCWAEHLHAQHPQSSQLNRAAAAEIQAWSAFPKMKCNLNSSAMISTLVFIFAFLHECRRKAVRFGDAGAQLQFIG